MKIISTIIKERLKKNLRNINLRETLENNRPINRLVNTLPYPTQKLIKNVSLYKLWKKVRDRQTNRVLTGAATILANNPNPSGTYVLERTKKAVLKHEICNNARIGLFGTYIPEKGWRFEFTLREFMDFAQYYNRSFSKKDVAKRHLESEVYLGELKKDVRDDEEIYIYDGDTDALDRIILPPKKESLCRYG